MLKIEYDNNALEVEESFMRFWRKYAMRRSVMLSIVFVIAIIGSINLVIFGVGMAQLVGGIITGLAGGMLFNLWYKPKRLCRKIVSIFEQTEEETYSASFDDKEIIIETITKVDLTSEELVAVEKSTFGINEEELYSIETQDMFMLFVNKALIYVFPKRCLSEHEIGDLRGYFSKKGI
ncbi:MAG: YcxB family protein [Oscillospiraceae bacterium]|nr:YcxB family protein [Oscillospiraceae bacterium]